MTKRFVALVVSVAGCGGAPFNTIDDFPTPEAGVHVDSGGIDGDSHDGGGTDSSGSVDALGDTTDAHSESTVNEAAPPMETGPLCTAFTGTFDNCNSTPLDNEVPRWFDVLTEANEAPCAVAMTPQACQCLETYNCACIKANYSCSKGIYNCVDGPTVQLVCNY